MKAWLAKHWFLLGMPMAVALAWLLPEGGATGGWLRMEITGKVVVAVVFFSQGLTLAAQALRDGASRWPLHLGVQVYGFVVVPLIGLLIDSVVGSYLTPDLRMGFLFLCVLPSTIVMSVILTSTAGGNVAAAVFNAVLSNLLGVVVTPAWVAWLMQADGGAQRLGSVLAEVSVLLLLPLVAGQVARRLGLATWADRNRKRLGNLSNGIILLLVYAAFCNSVESRLWAAHGWGTFAASVTGVLGLMVVTHGGAMLVGVGLKLPARDQAVMLFCGGQKSLATGIPLAKVIFGAHPGLGLILLPIMLFHPLQLLLGGMLAARHVRRHPVTNA